MNENSIQNMITVIAFKAVKMEYTCGDKQLPEGENDQNFDLHLENLIFTDAPHHFAKVFHVDIRSRSGLNNELVEMKIEYHVVFQCSIDVNAEFLQSSFAKISAPAIGFPYVRAYVSTISIQSGIPAIILPSINFVQLVEQQEKENTISLILK